MKTLLKLTLWLTLLALSLSGVMYAANNGQLNAATKHALRYYLKSQGVKAKFSDFQFKDGVLTSSVLRLRKGSATVRITNFKLQTSLSGNWSAPIFSAKLNPAQTTVLGQNDVQILNTEISYEARMNLLSGDKDYNFSVSNIKIDKFKDIDNNPLETGQAYYKYSSHDGEQIIDCKVQFGSTTYLNITNLDNNKIQIEAKNIPLMFYKLVQKLSPEHGLVNFFESYIKNGHVTEASLVLDLAAETISEDSLFGNVALRGVDYQYSKEFPTISKMDINLDVKGGSLVFAIDRGYSSSILLYDGVIKMDWLGAEKTVLFITAKGKGDVLGLVDFISESTHAETSKANIDFRKLKGEAFIDIDVKVPLKTSSVNIYNISADIQNVSLGIFKDSVHLKETTLSGRFDGDQVTIRGDGELNGFKSELDFVYNIEDESGTGIGAEVAVGAKDKLEFDHKLDIKTYFKSAAKMSGEDQKIGFISLMGGDSVVDFHYTNKDSKGFINIESDISDLDLYLDKLGIHKKKNDKANLTVNGSFDDPTTGVFQFSITGENKLSMSGEIAMENEEFTIDIKELKHKKTDLSGKIISKGDLLSTELHGEALDLSSADMMQLLEKEQDDGGVVLKLSIKKVYLKDNIRLDDLEVDLECVAIQCTSGTISAMIGTKQIEIFVTTDNGKEKWLIRSGNAGASLRGFGAYDAMRSGALSIDLTTDREMVKSGEIIPILSGTFEIKRFVLGNTPTMARIVSFVSLPGMVNAILGNKDIVFSSMSGNFSFKNSILTIENSTAKGPFFGFSLKGTVNIADRIMDINGHVTPSLYGVSSIVGAIPLIGRIFTGHKQQRGLISASYNIQDSY
ncbi:MAG: hypothetical protein COA94_00485 [Rickettsiales bacterium]|nr:MAG: hypothetical protein COA94_00485 [Rickettsiales bacterium]